MATRRRSQITNGGAIVTKQIPLTQGKVALVDDDVYEYLNQWKWRVQIHGNVWYAFRVEGKAIFMHRVITNAPKGAEVDHKDGDGLNNQRSNLRLCSRAENGANRRTNKNSTSGYKGVAFVKLTGRYRAVIRVNYKQINLGSYSNPDDAARAYDTAARKYFGEFASTNF